MIESSNLQRGQLLYSVRVDGLARLLAQFRLHRTLDDVRDHAHQLLVDDVPPAAVRTHRHPAEVARTPGRREGRLAAAVPAESGRHAQRGPRRRGFVAAVVAESHHEDAGAVVPATSDADAGVREGPREIAVGEHDDLAGRLLEVRHLTDDK